MGNNAYIARTLLICFMMTACATTGPTYKPMGPGETVGYTDIQLTPNRYRVSFSGGSGTKRTDVENYLLRRSAEVTAQAGYSYFVFDTRSMEASTYYRATFDTAPVFGPAPWYGAGPLYWSSWAYPAMWSGDVIPVTRYTAYAEIVMLTTEQAANRPEAIPARDVLDRLVPATRQSDKS